MSSKVETMNKSKPTLIPKRRFPEFVDGDGWQAPRLSDLYRFKRTNTLSRDKLNYEAGMIKNIHYGDIHTKFKPLFCVDREDVPFINAEVSGDAFKEEDDCQEGDIVLADASEDLNDIGKAIEIISLDGQRVVAGTHTILATRRGSIPIVGFGGYLFQSPAVRAGIQRESQGAKVYGISANRISPVVLLLPPTKAEQQKIADCLGSLDGLIVAEGRKLAALRDHKRGLMQRLFPQPGKTQPHLRFSEFRNKGEWEESTIGSRCRSFSGGTPDTTKKNFYGGTIPFIRSAEISCETTGLCLTKEGFENSAAKMIARGDVLVALYGANSGDVALARVDGAINQAILCLRPDEGSKAFLYHYLTYKKAWIIATYLQGGQGNLSGEIVKLISLRFPSPEEQEVIADCLTALDSLITAQAAKIEALKQHQRSLMQQLFPAQVEQ